jgi:hypothetical protein
MDSLWQDHMARMRNFSQSPGLITSFSQSVVSGEFFLGYHGWETLNRNASIYIPQLVDEI